MRYFDDYELIKHQRKYFAVDTRAAADLSSGPLEVRTEEQAAVPGHPVRCLVVSNGCCLRLRVLLVSSSTGNLGEFGELFRKVWRIPDLQVFIPSPRTILCEQFCSWQGYVYVDLLIMGFKKRFWLGNWDGLKATTVWNLFRVIIIRGQLACLPVLLSVTLALETTSPIFCPLFYVEIVIKIKWHNCVLLYLCYCVLSH